MSYRFWLTAQIWLNVAGKMQQVISSASCGSKPKQSSTQGLTPAELLELWLSESPSDAQFM